MSSSQPAPKGKMTRVTYKIDLSIESLENLTPDQITAICKSFCYVSDRPTPVSVTGLKWPVIVRTER